MIPTTGREPFYVMELCDGGSLADRLRTRDRLEPDEVVDVIGAVAAGLADLHARGFVHRDVKPHNILFDHERARLADFGLARSEEASELTSLTASGATVGTLAYIAPELLRGDPATPASDVYALGVVAFQGLTGRLPRPATAVAELVESHGEPAPTASSIVPELGTAFDAPIAAALATDPTARPAPEELADGLAVALSGTGAPEGARAAAVPAVAVASIDPNDPDADTVTDIRPEWPADAPGPARAERPGPPVGMLAVGVIGLALVALLALTSLLGDGDGAGADPTPPASATASASPSAVATPSATPAPTPTPDPTPPPDPAAAAFAALDRVDAAIEGLAADEEIRKKDLDTIRKRAGEIRKALEAGNYGQARDRTARLSSDIAKMDDRAEERRDGGAQSRRLGPRGGDPRRLTTPSAWIGIGSRSRAAHRRGAAARLSKAREAPVRAGPNGAAHAGRSTKGCSTPGR